MHTKLNSILSVAALSSALFFLPAISRAGDSSPSDPVAQRLAASGSVAVKNVGPYVEVGSYQILVRSKLGAPNARLADGSWLYNSCHAEDSVAQGTVVIRFDHGQVSQLSLVSPAVAVALLQRSSPKQESVAMVGR
jgi:hypothetical protein